MILWHKDVGVEIKELGKSKIFIKLRIPLCLEYTLGLEKIIEQVE